MLKTGLFLAVLSVGAAVAGCAHTNAHTKARTDFDPTADFARYHTYYWAGGEDASGDRTALDELEQARLDEDPVLGLDRARI